MLNLASYVHNTPIYTTAVLVPVSARKWNDTIREAREDIASGRRRAQAVRGGDSAPPRLSAHGFRSVATLLRQRARADEVSLSWGDELLPTRSLVPGIRYRCRCVDT